jgi:hypothetical protein
MDPRWRRSPTRSTSGSPFPAAGASARRDPAAAASSSRRGQILSRPVTTIAWRLSHLAVGVFGLRASCHFGDGSLTHENAERPLTAKEGVAYFKEQALRWRSHIERLDEQGLARPVGEPEAYLDAPMASLVLHVNREALHHLAEVSLLRDLYRATGGARLA